MKIFTKIILTTAILFTLASCESPKTGSSEKIKHGPSSNSTSRLNIKNSSLLLINENEEKVESKFEHIASVSAPISPSNNIKMQSTSVALLNEKVAIVTYNNVGIDITGAIDIISVENVKTPQIIETLYFENSEFSDVIVFKNNIYVTGVSYDLGAIIKSFKFQNDTLVENETIDLPGYYATNITLNNDEIFVNIGDNHGVSVLTIDESGSLTIKSEFLKNDSLFVANHKGAAVILSSSAEETITILKEDFTVKRTLNFENFYKEAPAEVLIHKNSIFTNANNGSLIEIDLNNGKIQNTINVAGTGNGLATDGSSLFLAQGEEGLMSFSIENKELIFEGTLDFSDDNGSANSVTVYELDKTVKSSYSNILFQGDGLGGLKIIGYKKDQTQHEDNYLVELEAEVLGINLELGLVKTPVLNITNSMLNKAVGLNLQSNRLTNYAVGLQIGTQIEIELDKLSVSTTSAARVCVTSLVFSTLEIKTVRRKNLLTGIVETVNYLPNDFLCLGAQESLIVTLK